jgi:hypothetical protein
MDDLKNAKGNNLEIRGQICNLLRHSVRVREIYVDPSTGTHCTFVDLAQLM